MVRCEESTTCSSSGSRRAEKSLQPLVFWGRNLLSKGKTQKEDQIAIFLPRQNQNPALHLTEQEVLLRFYNPIITTFVPADFYFKNKLPPPKKATFRLSKILNFPFSEVLLYFLALGEFYLGLYTCTTTQLFHFLAPFFFFSQRKTCLYQAPN